MRVQFAGSGDAFGSGGRFQTCISLSHNAFTLLVDCGATSLVALKSLGVDPGSVAAVAVTPPGAKHPTYGSARFSAFTDADFQTGDVTVTEPRITGTRWPGACRKSSAPGGQKS